MLFRSLSKDTQLHKGGFIALLVLLSLFSLIPFFNAIGTFKERIDLSSALTSSTLYGLAFFGYFALLKLALRFIKADAAAVGVALALLPAIYIPVRLLQRSVLRAELNRAGLHLLVWLLVAGTVFVNPLIAVFGMLVASLRLSLLPVVLGFAPLPGNLPRPLALRYHGHQFMSYNPALGDGRGFLFAQLRDAVDGPEFVAEIERRTVFRHFASKEALLDAFWVWINAQVTDRILPETLDELIEAPKQTFARFDEQEGIIRASLHTPSGREMRMRTIPKRREAFAAALSEVTRGLQEQDADRLVAAAHVLYSAAAWETLRDYCGLTGQQAGETVSFALRTLIEAAQRKQQRLRAGQRDLVVRRRCIVGQWLQLQRIVERRQRHPLQRLHLAARQPGGVEPRPTHGCGAGAGPSLATISRANSTKACAPFDAGSNTTPGCP